VTGKAPPGPPPLVGSHILVAGGLARAGLPYARALGAKAVQVFLQNPRGWACHEGDPEQDAQFREACQRDGIPVFVHSPYLVNLASPTSTTVERSAAAIRHAVLRGTAIGARGVVIHTGSTVVPEVHRDAAMRQVREALLPILDALPDGAPDLLLEPTAGAGRSLCATVDQLAPYLAALDHHPRLGVCLDTCHAFAAGHDVAAPGGATGLVDQLVAVIGAGRLRLVHANDSMDACGSGRDRHERIGRGRIGAAAFAELLGHPALNGVPVVLETPGDRDAHAEDVKLLKQLRRQRAGPSPAAS
jgi:deoxyribonuclease IV